MSRVAAISRASDEELKPHQDRRTAWCHNCFQRHGRPRVWYLAMAGFSVQDTIAAMPGL